MKKLNLLYIVFLGFITLGCTYEFPEAEAPTNGSADFSKMVVVGNSLSAGFMDGALYDAGQLSSFPNLIAQQMIEVNGGVFNQPDILSPIGNFGTAQGIPGVPDGTPLGRLQLKGLASPAPVPIIPGDPFNSTYGGDKSALNNFAVPGMRAIDASFQGYGLLNKYFGRFASDPATATVLGDAVAANGTFFIYWLGGNDALGYALSGGTGQVNGDGTNPADMTPSALFDAAFNASIDALLANDSEGVVATIPNVSAIPYFNTVPWNSIPLDPATAEQLNQGYADYNMGLLQAEAGGAIDAAERELRTIEFQSAAPNGVVIIDNDLTDLSGLGMPNIRLANNTDLLGFTAAAVIGQDDGNGGLIGISSPMGDEFSLTSTEQGHITERIDAFNTIIRSKVASSGGKLALFDAYEFFEVFAVSGDEINGSGISASIFPPYGAFSLDGVHLNQRGNAYVANKFIEAINSTFGSNIPLLNPNNLPGNALPVP